MYTSRQMLSRKRNPLVAALDHDFPGEFSTDSCCAWCWQFRILPEAPKRTAWSFSLQMHNCVEMVEYNIDKGVRKCSNLYT